LLVLGERKRWSGVCFSCTELNSDASPLSSVGVECSNSGAVRAGNSRMAARLRIKVSTIVDS
jgi:hypothetical protein